MRHKNADLYRKLVALLLAVGGAAGVILAVGTSLAMLSGAASGGGRAISAALTMFFALVFGLSTWAGVELWRGKPRAFRWAQVLLIAQMPIMSFPAFAYHFYTGVTLGAVLSRAATTTTEFEFELGSSMKFSIGSDSEGFVCGVNLAAAVALLMLGKARPEIESNAVAPAGDLS